MEIYELHLDGEDYDEHEVQHEEVLDEVHLDVLEVQGVLEAQDVLELLEVLEVLEVKNVLEMEVQNVLEVNDPNLDLAVDALDGLDVR